MTAPALPHARASAFIAAVERLSRGLILVLIGALVSSAAPAEAGSSFLITGALVVDGTGSPGKRADVRVVSDRILEVGQLSKRTGETVVDARGLVLAPGFIDPHSHHDDGLEKHPEAAPVVSQGITTILVGVDGFSRFPLKDYFAAREKRPAAINVASLVGHNSLRQAVMGDNTKRVATAAEIKEMRQLVLREMLAGAFGLSTGLEYDSGIYSNTAEVLPLAREAGSLGGIYKSHMRSEDTAIAASLEEIIRIGREANVAVNIDHLKIARIEHWGLARWMLARMEQARAEGVRLTADVYPYEYWQSTMTVLFPKRDFDNRNSAEFALKSLVLPEGMIFTTYQPDPSVVGKTLAEVARQRGKDAVTVYMDMIRDAEKYAALNKTSNMAVEQVMGRSMDSRDIDAFLSWRHSGITTDGQMYGRHPRGTGSFTKVLREYVREKKLLTLEAAIHKMTGQTARLIGLTDRGVIRPGAYADLVLFDPATISDRATIQDPNALSVGVRTVWVNGTPVFNHGQSLKAHPGRTLRHPAKAR